MDRTFLHGLGQTALDWKETIGLFENREISYAQIFQTGLVKEMPFILACLRIFAGRCSCVAICHRISAKGVFFGIDRYAVCNAQMVTAISKCNVSPYVKVCISEDGILEERIYFFMSFDDTIRFYPNSKGNSLPSTGYMW